MPGLELEILNWIEYARERATPESSRERRRRQPAEEAPWQTTTVVEDDPRRDGLAIRKHGVL
jgi:hypothetical protein